MSDDSEPLEAVCLYCGVQASEVSQGDGSFTLRLVLIYNDDSQLWHGARVCQVCARERLQDIHEDPS